MLKFKSKVKGTLRRDVLDPHKGFDNKSELSVIGKVKVLFEQMHEALGINLDDPNSSGTPLRAAKAYVMEFFGGLNRDNCPKMTVFPNNRNIDAIVLVEINYFHSVCAHHWAPFTGSAWIGYIPGKSVLGLSKFARLLDFYANRPQIQENLTSDVADHLEDILQPIALGVVIQAGHSCMCARGVKKHGQTMTSALRGAFLKKPEARKEFFDMIAQSRKSNG